MGSVTKTTMVIGPAGTAIVELPSAAHDDYPYRGPSPGAGTFEFVGWSGWKPSRAAVAILERELARLREAVCPLGWDVSSDFLVLKGREDRCARMHIFINGCEFGVPNDPELHCGTGLRVYSDELPEGRAQTLGECVHRVLELLPAKVDAIIAHMRAYPGARPAHGPHGPDCPCRHPPWTAGPCAGCNCGDP